MKITITNQQEFDSAVKFATQLARKDTNYQCDIFLQYENKRKALCHLFWEYTHFNPDKLELQILYKRDNIERFNLNYEQ